MVARSMVFRGQSWNVSFGEVEAASPDAAVLTDAAVGADEWGVSGIASDGDCLVPVRMGRIGDYWDWTV